MKLLLLHHLYRQMLRVIGGMTKYVLLPRYEGTLLTVGHPSVVRAVLWFGRPLSKHTISSKGNRTFLKDKLSVELFCKRILGLATSNYEEHCERCLPVKPLKRICLPRSEGSSSYL